jgi:PAS domain S-box-containing protein
MEMKVRIVLVEDENIVAMEIKDLLQGLGYVVCAEASSGEEAIRKAAETNPDLVLMDIRLKGNVDGIEAAQRIRTRFEIPVVYLTAYTDEVTLQRAKLTEPFGYLVKPFEERELHTVIEMALYKHRMESRLKERERWLATVLRSIGDAVIATDDKGLVTFMNPVAEALTGYKGGDSLGREAADVFRIVDEQSRLPKESPIGMILDEGHAVVSRKTALLVIGLETEVSIEYSAAPIQDDQGNVAGVVLVFRDVTERRQMEMALIHSERLAAMGHLSAALFHEINNPLQSISGSIELVSKYSLDEKQQAKYLQIAQREIKRLNRFSHQMLSFSRPPTVVRRAVLISDIVRHVLAVAGKQLQHGGIEVSVFLPDDLPPVFASHDQIVQVVLNLIINAIEAMHGGGRLNIEARLVDGLVEVAVADSGPGLSPDVLPKVFQPFYTTKEGGTGLGLSVSHNIIQQHGGTMLAENAPGGGAVFTIVLPLA